MLGMTRRAIKDDKIEINNMEHNNIKKQTYRRMRTDEEGRDRAG